MLVGNKKLSFTPSISSDVVEYRIRFAEAASLMNYSIPFSRISSSSGISVELDQTSLLVGDYSVFVTAVDAAGNESDQLNCGTFRRETMAKLNTKTLHFNPSESIDTTEYRIRIAAFGTAFSYDLAFSSVPAPKAIAGSPAIATPAKIDVDIGSLSVAPRTSGSFEVFVTAVDAAGNESDALVISGAKFDFVAPAAPTAGSIN